MDFENIYKSRKNILKMLKLRGYDTSQYDNQNKDELMVLFQNRDKKTAKINDTIDILIEGEKNKIFVKYILTDKTRSKAIEKYLESYYYEDEFLEKEDECIFITKDKVTIKGPLESFMNSLYQKDNIFSQVIHLSSLLYDITLNKLVPKYRILSSDEKESLLEKYNIKDEKLLPNLLIIDPLAIFYGVKLNQIVEIDNGKSKYYRLCIPSY